MRAAFFSLLVQRLRRESMNLKILRAAVAVAFGTVLVKLLSMAKDVLSASAFGTSADMDCFVLALTVPSYIINVVAGSLNAALIPTYTELELREGEAPAQRLLGNTLAINTLLLGGLALVVACSAPLVLQWLHADYSLEQGQVFRHLLLLLLPAVVLSGSSVVLSAIANTRQHFLAVALSGAIVPAAAIIAIAWGHDKFGIYALGLGTLLGFLFELVAIIALLRRWRVRIGLGSFRNNSALKTVLYQYLPVLSGSSLVCSSQLVDQIMSTTLGNGNVASLNYGIKLSAMLSGVGTMALGTALLPHFSAMSARQDWVSIRGTLRTYQRLILGVTIPLILIMAFCSESIVQIIFQRGAFSAEDTKLVGQIQSISVLQIPFISLAILFVRLLSALKMNHVLLITNIVGVILNVGLDYLFMQYWGVVGIALSTVVVYMVSAASLGFAVWLRMNSCRRNRS